MHSIWQDYIVDFGAVDEVTFDLRIGSTSGAIIYTGHPFRKPNETNLKVKINKPIADYIASLPRMGNAAFAGLTLPVTIYVMASVGAFSNDYNADYNIATYREYEHETFLNDWSYDYGFTPAATQRLAFPITKKVSDSFPVVFSTCNASETATFYKADGTTLATLTLSLYASRSDDYQREITAAGKGTIVFSTTSLSAAIRANLAYFTIGTTRYEYIADCNRYALYYRNPYGGWDMLILEGNCKRVDQQTASTYTKENANNYYPQNREAECYMNEVQPTFVLNTGLLTDAEAARVSYLLESPSVYLFDKSENCHKPALITDTQVTHQSFAANGCKICQYTINMKHANAQSRR